MALGPVWLVGCGGGDGGVPLHEPDPVQDQVTVRVTWSPVEQATHYELIWWTSIRPAREWITTFHDFAEFQAVMPVGTTVYARVRTCGYVGCSAWARTVSASR